MTLGKQEVGGKTAAPIWLYFMEKALQKTPVESFPVPQGIVFVKVNSQTGKPSSGAGTISEAFLEGAAPKERAGSMTDDKEDLFR
jgi:penicillin-binding protein 1A